MRETNTMCHAYIYIYCLYIHGQKLGMSFDPTSAKMIGNVCRETIKDARQIRLANAIFTVSTKQVVY